MVFYIVFETVLRQRGELARVPYLVFLLAGLFPWHWFANVVTASPSIFVGNPGLIKKVYFPRILLPLATLGSNLIHFLLALMVSIPILALYGFYPSPMWLVGIPILILIQCVLTLGVCLLISGLNVFFRDLEFLTIVFTNLLFFMTPILYPETIIPEGKRLLLLINPLYYIIPSWRNLMLEGQLDWRLLAAGAVYSLLILVVGHTIYRRLEWRFAESV